MSALDPDGLDGALAPFSGDAPAAPQAREPELRPLVSEPPSAALEPPPAAEERPLEERATFIRPSEPVIDRVSAAPQAIEPRRRRWPLAIAAGASLALAGALAVVLLPAPQKTAEPAVASPPPAPPPVAATPTPVPPPVAAPAASAPVREAAAGLDSVRFPARFAFNGARPLALDRAAVAELVSRARASCGGAPIVLTGHTCAIGSERANLRIGLLRAQAAARALAAGGLDPARVRLASAGSAGPVASNRTEAGRRANRRVTVSCAAQDPTEGR